MEEGVGTVLGVLSGSTMSCTPSTVVAVIVTAAQSEVSSPHGCFQRTELTACIASCPPVMVVSRVWTVRYELTLLCVYVFGLEPCVEMVL